MLCFHAASLWVKCVLCNNLQYYNLIGPYYIPVIGPRNSTWFTSPFSSWEVLSGHKTKVILAHIHSTTNKMLVNVLPLRCTEATVPVKAGTIIFAPLTHTYPGRRAEWSAPVHTAQFHQPLLGLPIQSYTSTLTWQCKIGACASECLGNRSAGFMGWD